MTFYVNEDRQTNTIIIHNETCKLMGDRAKNPEHGLWYCGFTDIDSARAKAEVLRVSENWSISESCYCMSSQ